MKVKKATQVKCHSKSQKWKDVRGKRCRPPITSSELNSSPVMARMIKEHQVSVKKKPTVKRLKNKAKSVPDSKKPSPQCTSKKSPIHANGNSSLSMDIESDDFEDWRQYSQSIHENGMETSGNMQDSRPGRLEGQALHCRAGRNDRQNHAVLVMQKDQVCFRKFLVKIWQQSKHVFKWLSLFIWLLQTLCFRGKCFLTCLYGRVEVMGFTIEEGQESYPLFSPASHCPLTIRALATSDHNRDARAEASVILQKYLSSGEWCHYVQIFCIFEFLKGAIPS